MDNFIALLLVSNIQCHLFWCKKGVGKTIYALGLKWIKKQFLIYFFVLLSVLLKMCVFPLQRIAKERQKQYNCLTQRIERERKLFIIAQKIQTRKDLLVRREP